MPGVFLSYRRPETDYAVLLYAWLAERFGTPNVFWDREDIDPGKDFRKVLSDRLADAEARNLLEFFLLEKAFYEMEYELMNRPAWLHVPLEGTLRILAHHGVVQP